MRLIQAPQLQKTNFLLEQFDPEVSFTIDAYKCKFTKKQKRQFKETGIYSYIALALKISFPDYKFDDLALADIQKTDIPEVKNALSFRISNLLNNYGTGIESALLKVFDSVIDFSNSSVYFVDKRLEVFYASVWFNCFIFYNKKRKRLLLFVVMASKK